MTTKIDNLAKSLQRFRLAVKLVQAGEYQAAARIAKQAEHHLALLNAEANARLEKK